MGRISTPCAADRASARENSESVETVHGLLNLKKPAGVTSRDVVNDVQRLARPAKVGHAGTLDPLATGVLVVCVGAATRLMQHIQQMPKTYLASFVLGRQSPTEDIQGPVTELRNAPEPALDQIVASAGALTGRIKQRPPAFSALKVQGRRAYQLARKGEEVRLEPRMVTVRRIVVVAYTYPELTLEIQCGSGTYIRSLGRDLAESLGTAAVMSALMRTSVGRFRVEEAIDPRELNSDNLADHLLPPLRAVEALPRVELSPEEIGRVRHGLRIGRPAPSPDAEQFAAVDAKGRLVAILAPRGAGELGPIHNLAGQY